MRTGDHDDVQDIRDELADLRAELESVRQTRAAPWTRARAKVRSMRRLTVVGIAALMLAVPVAVSAVHDFTDVPTSNTFHTSISRLVGAGITGGCGSGKYCPNSAVTRGQMAAFLNRGLGRMGSDFQTVDDDDWASFEAYVGVAQVDLLMGGGSGGSALAWASGSFSAWTNEPGVCPCEVQLYLVNDTTGEGSDVFYGMIGSELAPPDPNIPDSTSYGETSVTVSHAFSVDSGATHVFDLVAKVIPTNAPTVSFISGWTGTLQVLYVPFDDTGENPDSLRRHDRRVRTIVARRLILLNTDLVVRAPGHEVLPCVRPGSHDGRHDGVT